MVNEGIDVVDEYLVFKAGKQLDKFGGGPNFDLIAIYAAQINLFLENFRELHRLLSLGHVFEPSGVLIKACALERYTKIFKKAKKNWEVRNQNEKGPDCALIHHV